MARLCTVPHEREQGCEVSTVTLLTSTYSSVSRGGGGWKGQGASLSCTIESPESCLPPYLCLLLDRLNQNLWGEVWAKAPDGGDPCVAQNSGRCWALLHLLPLLS